MSFRPPEKDFVETVRQIVRVRKERKFSEEENAVRKLVMQAFRALGRAPSASEIGQKLQMSSERVNGVLRSLDEADVLYLEDDQIIAAYPFSNKPTKHRVIFSKSKTEAYAMCAIDALGIPFMFQENATILSRCGYCEKDLEIQVNEGRANSNEDAVVFFGFERSRHAATSSCPILQFFCCKPHLANWRIANSTKTGAILSLNEALILGGEIFGGTLDIR